MAQGGFVHNAQRVFLKTQNSSYHGSRVPVAPVDHLHGGGEDVLDHLNFSRSLFLLGLKELIPSALRLGPRPRPRSAK